MDADSVSATASALPTVREVLELPELRRGGQVLAAAVGQMDKRVRWAHVMEVADFEGMLLGGELVLTTGVALPGEDRALRDYVAALATTGVSALIVELGRRFSKLPAALVRACERRGVPLVALTRPVRFVRVTEQVHARILAAHTATLQTSEAAHRRLMGLCVEGTSVGEMVAEVAALADAPVVLENLMHQVLAAHPHTDRDADADVLTGWADRSRNVQGEGLVSGADGQVWVVRSVRARGTTWGRLIVLPDTEPSPVHELAAERGATALALLHLLQSSARALEQEAHRATLLDLINRRYASLEQMHTRTAALGVPTARQQLWALVLRAGSSGTAEVLDTVAEAARSTGGRAVAAEIAEGYIGVLLTSGGTRRGSSTVAAFADQVQAAAVRHRSGWLPIGVADPIRNLDDVPPAFAEARHVCDAALATGARAPYFTASDVQLPGLLSMLGDDPRVQLFVERSVGRLVAHDARQGTALLDALRAYLEAGGNTTSAAQRLGLSRQGLYSRLAAVQRVLGTDITQPAVRTSLHAALMAWDAGSRSAAQLSG